MQPVGHDRRRIGDRLGELERITTGDAVHVAALRKAFMATMADPALVAEANKSGMELGERSGEEVQALVQKLYALPASTIARAKKAMIYKPAGK